MLTQTHRFISVPIALVLLVTAFISIPVHAKAVMTGNEVKAADGDLDATFGTGGIVTTDFSNDFDFGASVVIQPDGKIVVVGWSFIDNRPNPDFVLARYTPDGSLDPTFDNDGKVITDFASQDDMYAVTLQADGKILLAGTVDMSLFELVRYNSDGSLDTTFDVDGIVTTALGQNVHGSAYAIAVQPDEKIVLAGQMWSSSDSDFALVRYNNDGSLDTGFGGNGIVTTDFGTHAAGNAVVIQPTDGKIIVAGESGNTDNKSITLARYNSDGSLDTTFDSDGKVITSLGINDIAEDLTLQPDGKIIAAGSGNNSDGDQDFVLVRYNNDGSLDTTFGLNGRVLTDFGSREHGRAVAVQPDGRILMTGAGNDRTTLALARYQSNGALDTSFGVNGKVITSVPDTIVGFDLALQHDHNIIVVGGCCNSSNVDFMVARYIYHAAPATTLMVTKTADTNDGICDADCSLREAIVSSYDGDVIRFDSSLAGKTITLASTLVIDRDLSIDGSALASKVIVSGDETVTVFETTPGATAILKSLIVTNGRASGSLYGEGYSGGINNFGTLNIINSTISHNGSDLSEQGNGGGIFNSGSLHITGSIIANNFAHFGGGIFNFGDLTIQDSTISDNEGLDVGGILNSGTLTVINTTISNNSSSYEGGGVQNQGIINISNSTISGNKAGYSGGGLSTNGETSIINSTFINNSAALGGGGIFGNGSLTIVNSTISGNSAGTVGGGIHNMGTLNMTNTVLANSTSGSDCYNDASTGVIGVNVKNLMEGNAAAPNHCGTPALSSDPLLGAPASNGGFTQTMALQAGSPAIDAGNNANCPAKDQRGITRPQGAGCDMGAFEVASTFADVPLSHPYYQDIEILYANGLTGGCSTNPLKFCPDQIMNRGQAAVFILRANFGSGYVPPVPTHIFKDDWTKGPWAESWAEGMRAEGLSAGCLTNPPKYCPWDQIPREQAVIFALRMEYGTLYAPPPATGTVFADMTNPNYYATSWAEQAYKDGLIANCGMSGNKPLFCPKNLVSRGLAAYMIVRAKNLTMP